jgi:hypothetical protein
MKARLIELVMEVLRLLDYANFQCFGGFIALGGAPYSCIFSLYSLIMMSFSFNGMFSTLFCVVLSLKSSQNNRSQRACEA